VDLNESFDRRPLTPDDADAWAKLLKAIAEHDGDDEIFSKEDLREDFSDPLRDFAQGSVAVFDGPAMVGYSVLSMRATAEPVHDMRQSGGVHPDYRGADHRGKLGSLHRLPCVPAGL
jgi:mycothiol synthase